MRAKFYAVKQDRIYIVNYWREFWNRKVSKKLGSNNGTKFQKKVEWSPGCRWELHFMLWRQEVFITGT